MPSEQWYHIRECACVERFRLPSLLALLLPDYAALSLPVNRRISLVCRVAILLVLNLFFSVITTRHRR